MTPLLERVLRSLDAFVLSSGVQQVPPAVTADELRVVREHVELLIYELDKATETATVF